MRRAIAFASGLARGAPDGDLGEHRRALAVGDDLAPAQVHAHGAQRRGEHVVVDARTRRAPDESSTTASFVEHSPSIEIELKLASTPDSRKSIASPGSSG